MNLCGYKITDGVIEIVDCADAQSESVLRDGFVSFDKKGDMIKSVEKEMKECGEYQYAGKYERATKTIRIFCIPDNRKLHSANYDKVTDNLYALYFDLSLKRGRHLDDLRY